MPQSPVRVWATGEGVRVNPETGRYLEDRRDVHVDYPSGDYQRRNAVWDAKEGRIALQSARNEFVSFQLIVERDDVSGLEAFRGTEPVKGIEVTFDRLVGQWSGFERMCFHLGLETPDPATFKNLNQVYNANAPAVAARRPPADREAQDIALQALLQREGYGWD